MKMSELGAITLALLMCGIFWFFLTSVDDSDSKKVVEDQYERESKEIPDTVNFYPAYAAYRAYDDGEFSDSELSDLGEIEAFNDLIEDGKLSDDNVLKYELMVNDLIEEVDSSEDKLEFKNYVLDAEAEDFVIIGLDGKLDERERELLMFAGDVTGSDASQVVDVLEKSFADGTYNSDVVSYENLVKSLYKDSEDIDVDDIRYVWDRDAQLFKMDK